MASRQAALGFRVKSGWATAVLVAGPARSPRVLDRRVVELSDPRVPRSRQPYHVLLDRPGKGDAKVLTRLVRVVRSAARRSVTALLRHYLKTGHAVRGAGLVVGSTIDPARIGNDHIRAHALEGQLFRTALEQALRSRRVRCAVMVERDAYRQAAGALKRTAGQLKQAVAALGESVDGPWRADEKVATLAAWIALREGATR